MRNWGALCLLALSLASCQAGAVVNVAAPGATADAATRLESPTEAQLATMMDEAKAFDATQPPSVGGSRSSATTGGGRVKWFDSAKGYGYISPDDASGDLFVHFSAISTPVKNLQAGQAVAFDVVNGPRGRQATRVRAL